jgi:hypothetical protein
MFNKKVACGSFVKRQTKESGYSHFEGNWDQLEVIAESRLNKGLSNSGFDCVHQGYRDGVVLVDMPPAFFRSAIIELNEKSKLKASYAPRRSGEDSFIRLSAQGKKQFAKYASVVLYRHDVLAENNERETDAEWEIVCIKARTTEEEDPLHYYTMARNYLELPGGTKGNFSADDFAKSIVYWSQHAMTSGKPKWYKKIAKWVRSY